MKQSKILLISSSNPFQSLPSDLQNEILSHLDISSQIRFASTSKKTSKDTQKLAMRYFIYFATKSAKVIISDDISKSNKWLDNITETYFKLDKFVKQLPEVNWISFLNGPYRVLAQRMFDLAPKLLEGYRMCIDDMLYDFDSTPEKHALEQRFFDTWLLHDEIEERLREKEGYPY